MDIFQTVLRLNIKANVKNVIRKKLLKDPKLYANVKDKFLNEQWSPEEIDERPAAANDRSRLRYWEDDTVAGITGKACLGHEYDF